MKKLFTKRFKSWLAHDRGENGQAMLLVALSMVVLLGFAAFAVDVGNIQLQKSNLQNAADAAALAGVVEMPSIGNASTTARTYAQKNGMSAGEVSVSEAGTNRLRVECNRSVDFYFAGVLGFESKVVTAVAVAEKNVTTWSGDALPFLNENLPYSQGGKFVVRDKSWGGSFDSIDKVDRGEKLPGAYWAFDINYEDGLIVKNGMDNSIQKSVQDIYDAGVASGNRTVYLFSLSNEVMTSNQVKVIGKNGTISTKAPTSLGTNDNVHPSQLVLLKCTFDNCANNSKDLDFTITGMYDLGNNYKDGSGNNLPDYPTDYQPPSGGVPGAHLVE